MKPRIEKKLSKKLALQCPKLLKGAWIDADFELWQKYYPHQFDGKLTSKQKRLNLQQRVRVNNIYSIGGGLDYWGEGEDYCSCWEWLLNNWRWIGNFPSHPHGNEFFGYPDTSGFKPTTRNLLQLAYSKK